MNNQFLKVLITCCDVSFEVSTRLMTLIDFYRMEMIYIIFYLTQKVSNFHAAHLLITITHLILLPSCVDDVV